MLGAALFCCVVMIATRVNKAPRQSIFNQRSPLQHQKALNTTWETSLLLWAFWTRQKSSVCAVFFQCSSSQNDRTIFLNPTNSRSMLLWGRRWRRKDLLCSLPAWGTMCTILSELMLQILWDLSCMFFVIAMKFDVVEKGVALQKLLDLRTRLVSEFCAW